MNQSFIQSLSTTAGYLENAPISFSTGLNCVIGSRGTCKSTIVETLRFCFDCDPTRVRDLLARDSGDAPEGRRGLVAATLGGGTARATLSRVEPGGTVEYLVERDGADGGEPRVYRDSVREQLRSTVLSEIEIYSQGDLHRIATDGAKRLELIDRPNFETVQEKRGEIAELGRSLSKVGRAIRARKAELDSKRSSVRSLAEYRAQLAEIRKSRPVLSEEMDTEREAHLRRETVMRQNEAAIVRRREILLTLADVSTEAEGFRSLAARISAEEGKQASAVADVMRQFGDLLTRVGEEASIQSATIDLDPLRSEFETMSARYFEIRRDQAEVNESLRKEDACNRQIGLLESMEKEADAIEADLAELLTQRSAARARIAELRDAVTALRLEQIDEINSVFGAIVFLTLESGSEYRPYLRFVEGLLKGSKLRDQNEVARDLATRVPPADLVDIVEAGDAPRLAALLKRDIGQMTRLLGFLMDLDGLYDLEAQSLDDYLEVTMYVDGVPKPIHALSKGQMATALLPLILRDAPYPLVFDQPEDDLDNKFIYDTLITKIAGLKTKRQLIFITHNANIPVLGDAENVVVMSMATPTAAAQPVAGSVDQVKGSILSLLEGGAMAFQRRSNSYGSLVEKLA